MLSCDEAYVQYERQCFSCVRSKIRYSTAKDLKLNCSAGEGRVKVE